jgi:hypothetical protein
MLHAATSTLAVLLQGVFVSPARLITRRPGQWYSKSELY